MTRRTGFTLIELLVVIAIIAILAAIIFPVFMRAKENAYRAGDMSNMNAIRNALQLYRADQEVYPPAILGYATFYASGPQTGQVIPAGLLRAALYPKRLDSIQTMRPAFDANADNAITTAFWPNADNRLLGDAPVGDLNGDGIIDQFDDSTQARQAYSSNTLVLSDPLNSSSPPLQYYQISGYDVALVKVPPSTAPPRWETHYALRWSTYAITGGNRQDDPRQLIYSEPPDNTVVTWNSWFREYDGAHVAQHSKKDYVLFLGGGARPYDSADMSNRSWRVLP